MQINEQEQVKIIEQLRRELEKLFLEKGSFHDPEVQAKSRELDREINRLSLLQDEGEEEAVFSSSLNEIFGF